MERGASASSRRNKTNHKCFYLTKVTGWRHSFVSGFLFELLCACFSETLFPTRISQQYTYMGCAKSPFLQFQGHFMLDRFLLFVFSPWLFFLRYLLNDGCWRIRVYHISLKPHVICLVGDSCAQGELAHECFDRCRPRAKLPGVLFYRITLHPLHSTSCFLVLDFRYDNGVCTPERSCTTAHC